MIQLIAPLLWVVVQAPTITEVVPDPLPLGAQAELSGTGFVPGQTTLRIGETSQQVAFADATRVRFAVAAGTPLGAQTLVVTVAGETDAITVDVVPPGPRIDTFEPDPVVLGALVTIEGAGLGTVNEATLDDVPCTITQQLPTLLELRVPFEASLLGPATLILSSPSGEDGQVVTVVAPAPAIETITPNPVRASTLVTVRGRILPQAVEVRVGTLTLPVVRVTTNEVLAWLPPTVALGSQPVIVRAAGKDSLPVSVVIQDADPLAPIVRAVYPSRVAAGGATWVIGEHLDAVTRVLPDGGVTVGACQPRMCRVSTAGLVAGPPFVVALDGAHGTATFQAELVDAAPEPVDVTRIEPSPARRGELLSIYAAHAASVRAVVIGGQAQVIDFFDEEKIVVRVHASTPLGSETLFIASNVGSEPFALAVLDPAPGETSPEPVAEQGAETNEAEPTPKDEGCTSGALGIEGLVVALGLAATRRRGSSR